MFLDSNYEEIEKLRDKSIVFIDLRSEDEFKEATIPGALNIPILSNEERVDVGTEYVKGSIQIAKEKGITYVSKKLPYIYKKISNLVESNDMVVIFCSRGGYRSTALFNLLKSLHINVYKLNGGYKNYRAHIVKNLESLLEDISPVLLTGNTGSGKTEILTSLKRKGADVIDLESLANHRGSLLGGVGLGKQPSQKMFESNLYEVLKNRKSNLVFFESESRRIGKIFIPNCLADKMSSGNYVLIEDSLARRIKRIREEYVQKSDDDIIESLESLRRYMSDTRIDKYIEMLENKNYDLIIQELIEKYYDKNYKKTSAEKIIFRINNFNSDKSAEMLIDFFKDRNL